jgi:hypothetical protein
MVAAALAPARAEPAAFGTFGMHSGLWLKKQKTSTLQTIANRYDYIILKGPYPAAAIATMEAANPSLKFINYEQSYALNPAEAAEARANGWLAQTCAGEEIHPTDVPSETLMDNRIPEAREWRSSAIAAQTATGTFDGTYLDTLGALYPVGHYTGDPCGITDRDWLDASKSFLDLVKQKTSKPVVLNGRGLGSGRAYFASQAAVDELISVTTPAVDVVHIEFFMRQPHARCTRYRTEVDWQKDIDYIAEIGRQGRIVFANQKVHVSCTEAQHNALRDYGLGSFMLGAQAGLAYIRYGEGDDVLGRDPDNGWMAACGPPLGPYAGGAGEVRRRAFTLGSCDIGVNPTSRKLGVQGVSFAAHTARRF